MTILVLNKIDIKLSPYVVSFSMFLYTIIIVFFAYFIEVDIFTEIEEGPAWKLWLSSIISCIVSILFIGKKTE